jgi:DNA repair exonuclease SbcCD ATPase subunit
MGIDDDREQPAGGSPMEQVRDILLGAHLKDMEIRFQRQEDRLTQEISDVRDFFKKRLDSLENFMKREVSGLLERLRLEVEERDAARKAEQKDRTEALAAEQRERTEALKNEERERQETAARLASDLAAHAAEFERKLAKLSQTLDSAERDLRALLMDESTGLNDKIEAKYSDVLRALDRTNAQIRNDMVYRAALSGLLAETVGGLARPWNAEALGVPAEPSEPARFRPAREEETELPARLGSADNY